MIIDFHTHCFPDKIYQKTISHLSEKGSVPHYRDGSAADLRRSSAENGIDWSLVAPIATAPKQQDSILRFAVELHGKDHLLSLGSVHPDAPDMEQYLIRTKEAGLPGIKLHPDYQGFYIDEPRALRVIDCAAELGLCVLIHAGLDTGFPDDIHCPPRRAAKVLDRLEGKKVVLAHLGGYGAWEHEEAVRLLCGRDIYLDTSFSYKSGWEEAAAVVAAHPKDRVLFGSDSPWDGQGHAKAFVEALPLTGEERAAVLGGNAARLLGLAEAGE